MNITGSTLKIVPPPNWFGTEEIFLTVSDGKYSNSTKFTLEVIPVNDRPGKFSLLYPKNESQIEINNSNEKDSLDFVWTKSIDVDGDSVKYLLYFNMETAKVESTVTFNNVFTYSYPDLLKYFADKKYLSLTWSVFVTDGVDTIYADNSSFVLKLSNNIVGIDENVLPTKYYLYNAFPNPFNPATMIEYDIPELSQVELQVYDLLGRLIKTVVNEEKPAGRYSVRFDGGELSSGIYFYKLQAGPFLQIKKFVLLK